MDRCMGYVQKGCIHRKYRGRYSLVPVHAKWALHQVGLFGASVAPLGSFVEADTPRHGLPLAQTSLFLPLTAV